MGQRKKLASLMGPVFALICSIVVSYLVIAASGYDAGLAFGALYNATFENARAIGSTLNKASPLIFTGIAVAFSFRGNMFNIGTEGQFLMGATGATLVGIYCKDLPGFLLIPCMMLAGILCGAFWSTFPGICKAKFGVSEVITTIMFNYIAINFLGFLVRGPIQDTKSVEPQSFLIAKQGYMTYLLKDSRLHAGFFIACIMAVLLYILLFHSAFGYEVRAVGHSPTAARNGGINVPRTMMISVLISGALAGLGGAIELAGTSHYLHDNISPGYGYTAIAVSILAKNNPLGVILSSLLFGFLNAGSTAMQRTAGLSASFIKLFQGIVVFFIAVTSSGRMFGGLYKKKLRAEKTKGNKQGLKEEEVKC